MTIDSILQHAQLSREIGQDKIYVPPQGFLLVSACRDAVVAVQNRPQIGSGYLHEVTYKGYRFVSVSNAPLALPKSVF